MKKHTTWEAIKMLSENPKLKFNLIYCGNETADKNLEVKDNMIIINAKNPFHRYLNISAEWVLVQQPVSFIEAVEAYSKGKTIYCEFNNRKYIYEPDVIKKCIVAEEGYVVEDDTESSISTGEILRGKWFIEEGEGYDR